jgi:hypothetical protein
MKPGSCCGGTKKPPLAGEPSTHALLSLLAARASPKRARATVFRRVRVSRMRGDEVRLAVLTRHALIVPVASDLVSGRAVAQRASDPARRERELLLLHDEDMAFGSPPGPQMGSNALGGRSRLSVGMPGE